MIQLMMSSPIQSSLTQTRPSAQHTPLSPIGLRHPNQEISLIIPGLLDNPKSQNWIKVVEMVMVVMTPSIQVLLLPLVGAKE